MKVNDLKDVLFTDAQVIEIRKFSLSGSARYILFEGDLMLKGVDPEILDREVESISVFSLGKIRITVK